MLVASGISGIFSLLIIVLLGFIFIFSNFYITKGLINDVNKQMNKQMNELGLYVERAFMYQHDYGSDRASSISKVSSVANFSGEYIFN
jgi:hypothetical protein